MLSRLASTMKTLVLKCDPSKIIFPADSHLPVILCQDTKAALAQATEQLLKLRRPVVVPTETVYGLAAPALDSEAAIQIFQIKNRPPDNPLIVHISSFPMLHRLLPRNCSIPPSYQILMNAFWPGPLTLLFPTNPGIVPPLITANHATVAVRMPSHPVARALITLSDSPLAAPSANSSGKPSPTRANHVQVDLAGKVGVILDGGSSEVGLESTVVDGLQPDGNIRVLRPGGVTVEDMERVFKCHQSESFKPPTILVHRKDFQDADMEQAPTTPGMKYRHYSPSVPVELVMTLTSPRHPGVSRMTIQEYVAQLCTQHKPPDRRLKLGVLAPVDGALARCPFPPKDIELIWRPLGSTTKPSEVAHGLFDGLLSLDSQGVDRILVEEIAEMEEGLAVMNRVSKAASSTVWIDLQL